MSRAVVAITEMVRDRVRRDGVDLRAGGDLADRYVRDAVRNYSERALGGAHPLLDDEQAATRSVLAAITGFGVLQPYLDDPAIEELWVNQGSRVFVARGGASEELDVRLTPQETRDLVERMLSTTGRRVDLSMPFVDASLPDGSRLHVASGDVARGAMSINIRKFSRRLASLETLVELGTLSHQAATFLQRSVLAGANILVSGATHSGKTTLLGALMGAGRPRDRVVTVEETFELDPQVADVVALQCRQPSLEGTGEITLRQLVKESLRMRPDRLVVGEVRGAEALDLLIALNSGVAGAGTIHANTARDALQKLTTLPLLAGRNIDAGFVVPTVAACVDLVVHCAMDARGNRRVTEILAPTGTTHGHVIEASQIFHTVGSLLRPTGGHPSRLAKYEAAGIDMPALLARDDA
ncbi:CpaF family protein [Agrococcus jejuensis]|uniref:Pilus assembly protein CpaF n=1 Tax=Agrococcus jejuensis TaxID=399736 RepID=A0A1G8GC56_9MICO|nr:ATPase, T2SS/T4P/T4SS family [Agrococcus jejuensis]SDH91933.1 pilus assembly protein CpaF [Agrococcus jejuensis]